MSSTPAFERFLAEATGLTRARALEIYRAGYPWPLFTTEDIRKAAILAQAKSLLLSDALAEVERKADAEHDEMLMRMAEVEQAQGKAYLEEKAQALASMPCLKEGLDHMRLVISSTQEQPSTIFRLFLAIQRYAISHPNWTPSFDGRSWSPELVSREVH